MDRPKPARTVAAALLAATALVGAGQAPAPAAQTAGTQYSTAAASVSIGDDYFSPSSVTVTAGQSVTWSNTGDDHTVTANDDSFDSGNLVSGATYQRTFNTAGTYGYRCLYHDGMTGTVTVSRAPVVVSVVSFGPNPLRLAGTGRLKAVYRIGQPSTLRARVQRLEPTTTVKTFPLRNKTSAGQTTYYWDGRNNQGANVRPGKFRMGLTVTDRAGTSRTVWRYFRVVR